MTRWAAVILPVAIVFGGQAGGASAQTPAATQQIGTEPVTAKPDRTTADRQTREKMAQRRAALRQKRIDCSKQADAQGLHLLKRIRFIRKCMAGRELSCRPSSPSATRFPTPRTCSLLGRR